MHCHVPKTAYKADCEASFAGLRMTRQLLSFWGFPTFLPRPCAWRGHLVQIADVDQTHKQRNRERGAQWAPEGWYSACRNASPPARTMVLREVRMRQFSYEGAPCFMSLHRRRQRGRKYSTTFLRCWTQEYITNMDILSATHTPPAPSIIQFRGGHH